MMMIAALCSTGYTTSAAPGKPLLHRVHPMRAALVARNRNAVPVACDDGLSEFELIRQDGKASAKFSIDGGHITSWVCNGEDHLFVSKEANFIPDKLAIRGGVPLCWPAFNERNLKAGKHGIVRTSERWTISEAGFEPDEFMVLEHEMCYLEVDPSSSSIVGYHYAKPVGAEVDGAVIVPASLSLRVEVRPSSLRMELQAANNGNVPFSFSTVFHNYFSVNEMPVTVYGLQGKGGKKDGEAFTDDAEGVVVDGGLETQRLYVGVKEAVSWETTAANGATKRLTLTTSDNLPDIVLWNAGKEGAKALKDMESGGELRYLCVEPGICESAEATVAAGETWSGWQEISVELV